MKRNLSILMAACIMASLLPVNIRAAENLTVTPTDITADRVSNFEGFGNITMYDMGQLPAAQGEWNITVGFESASESAAAYHGLVNRDLVVFPYSKGNFSYTVYGDVISYIGGDQHFTDSFDFGNWNMEDAVAWQPRYYDLYGNRLFEWFNLPDVLPEWMELEEIAARGYTISDWGSSPMNNGYAKVFLNYHPDAVGGNLIAFIDKTGKVTCILDEIDPDFNTPNMSECKGLGWFGDNGWIAYSEPNDYSDDDGIFMEESSRILGYMDEYGQTALDVSHMNFVNAWPFAEGFSVVQDRSGLKGAIDTNGNLAIPCIYWDITSVSNGVLGVKSEEGKWGYIDINCQTVVPCMYDDVYGWADGLGAVVLNGKCGLVDDNNNIVLPLEYDDITSFTNGVCYGIKDRKLYVITR